MAAGTQIKRLQIENQKLQQVIDSLLRENYELRNSVTQEKQTQSNESKRV